jgi:membrane associated rhomboid family serine protease
VLGAYFVLYPSSRVLTLVIVFFAHVGGFVFGYLAARLLAGAGAQAPATASA